MLDVGGASQPISGWVLFRCDTADKTDCAAEIDVDVVEEQLSTACRRNCHWTCTREELDWGGR